MKLHWTQRPENKEKVRMMTKRAGKTRRKNHKVHHTIKVALKENNKDPHKRLDVAIAGLTRKRDALTTTIETLREYRRRG